MTRSKTDKLSRPALQKIVGGKQYYQCANCPDSHIHGLENFKCPLWEESGECQGNFDEDQYKLDYVVPYDISKNNTEYNLRALCPYCYSKKHNISIWKLIGRARRLPKVLFNTNSRPCQALKRKVAGKQRFQCANRPGSNLKRLENIQCDLWNRNDHKGNFGPSSYEVDHIIERCISHDDREENLQALCLSCHNIKTRRFNSLDDKRLLRKKRMLRSVKKPIKKTCIIIL